MIILDYLKARLRLINQDAGDIVNLNVIKLLLNLAAVPIVVIAYTKTQNILWIIIPFLTAYLIGDAVFLYKKWKDPTFMKSSLSRPDWYFWNWDRTTWTVLIAGIICILVFGLVMSNTKQTSGPNPLQYLPSIR